MDPKSNTNRSQSNSYLSDSEILEKALGDFKINVYIAILILLKQI